MEVEMSGCARIDTVGVENERSGLRGYGGGGTRAIGLELTRLGGRRVVGLKRT